MLQNTAARKKKVTLISANHVVAAGDHIIVTQTLPVGGITVTLPALEEGRELVVKDGDGEALLKNITIDGGATNIDGATTAVIATNYGRLCIVGGTAKWHILYGI